LRLETATTSSILMKELPITTRRWPSLRAREQVGYDLKQSYSKGWLTRIDLLRVLHMPERVDVFEIHARYGEATRGPARREYNAFVRDFLAIVHDYMLCLWVKRRDCLWKERKMKMKNEASLRPIRTTPVRKVTPNLFFRSEAERHSSLLASVIRALLSFVLPKPNVQACSERALKDGTTCRSAHRSPNLGP
jgi:hypothetical protein